MLSSLCRSRLIRHSQARLKSAWMKVASEPTLKKHHGEQVNVEELFIDERVQELLKLLTGIDLEGKIFRERKINRQERSHYALMTNEMFDETLRKMAQHGKKFLQFVPVKEPRPETATVLSKDEDIADFDDSKFVFTDITFDATDQDRTVVVREVDGTLRTALPEEHDRMNRIYYNQPNRPVYMPPVFSDPDLQNALERDKHEFVLDWACYYFEPDDSTFVKLCTTVFDRTIETNKISLLHSTRHFGAFVFYAIINGKTPPLLNFFGQKGSIADAANLIRLHKIIYPDWRKTIGIEHSDRKIIEDYLEQNKRVAADVRALTALLGGRLPSTSDAKLDQENHRDTRVLKLKASLTSANIATPEGPLGEQALDYKVRLAKTDEQEKPTDAPDTKRQRRPAARSRSYDKTSRRPPKDADK